MLQLGLTDLGKFFGLMVNLDAASSILVLLLLVHWCGLVANVTFHIECCAVTAWVG